MTYYALVAGLGVIVIVFVVRRHRQNRHTLVNVLGEVIGRRGLLHPLDEDDSYTPTIHKLHRRGLVGVSPSSEVRDWFYVEITKKGLRYLEKRYHGEVL